MSLVYDELVHGHVDGKKTVKNIMCKTIVTWEKIMKNWEIDNHFCILEDVLSEVEKDRGNEVWELWMFEVLYLKKEEDKIGKPWKEWVIVNMIGRMIGFKALKNKLQQMWESTWVISILDMGFEYHLGTFTGEE